MRRSLGTAVFAGMLGVTLFGIFLTPVFFHVIQRVGETRLFTAAAVQWIGSVLIGAALGGAIAFFLNWLGVLPGIGRIWMITVGAVAGGLAVAAMRGAHARLSGKR
jgi:multidrug efflux pump